MEKSMENHIFKWENQLYMVIFNSYVKLPEGIWGLIYINIILIDDIKCHQCLSHDLFYNVH